MHEWGIPKRQNTRVHVGTILSPLYFKRKSTVDTSKNRTDKKILEVGGERKYGVRVFRLTLEAKSTSSAYYTSTVPVYQGMLQYNWRWEKSVRKKNGIRTSGEGRGCTHVMHGRSRMTIDYRIPTTPGQNMSGFHQPGRHCFHQARSMKAVLHPTKNRLWGGLGHLVRTFLHTSVPALGMDDSPTGRRE